MRAKAATGGPYRTDPFTKPGPQQTCMTASTTGHAGGVRRAGVARDARAVGGQRRRVGADAGRASAAERTGQQRPHPRPRPRARAGTGGAPEALGVPRGGLDPVGPVAPVLLRERSRSSRGMYSGGHRRDADEPAAVRDMRAASSESWFDRASPRPSRRAPSTSPPRHAREHAGVELALLLRPARSSRAEPPVPSHEPSASATRRDHGPRPAGITGPATHTTSPRESRSIPRAM